MILTAKQIGDRVGLTPQAVNRRARLNNIAVLRTLGKGGANGYDKTISNAFDDKRQRAIVAALFLPDGAASVASEPSAAEVFPADIEERRASLWECYDRAPAKKRARADHRAEIARAVDDRVEDLGWTGAYAVVAAARGLPIPTVRRWAEKVRACDPADYPAMFLDGYKGSQRKTKFDPIFDRLFREFYLRLTQPAAAVAYEKAIAAAANMMPGDRGAAAPSLKTLLRRLRREVHPDVIVFKREGGDALDHKYPHLQRDRSVFHATQAMNADGHRWDFFVRLPDGEVCRPMTVAVQDLYSNLFLAWRTGRSENRDAVRLAFGDAFRIGLPEHIFLDNGRGGMSKWLTGGMTFRFRFKIKREDPVGLFESLGIKVHATRPYHGQSKPIERAFRDLENHMRARPELTGAWCGNRPDAKPENYGNKAIALDVFLRVMDGEIAAYNRRLNRRTEIARGLSFQKVFDESYVKSPIRKATQAQLRKCMLAIERVFVSPKDSTINLFGNRYWSEVTQLNRGQHLAARFDPGNLQNPEAIFLYTLDDSFIGTCEVRDVVGFNDADAARDFHRAKKLHKRGIRMQAEAERRMDDAELRGLMVDAATPEAAAAKVVRPFRPKVAPPRFKPPLEHADRAEVDAAYEELMAERRTRTQYDEAAEVAGAIADYQRIAAIACEQRTKEDSDWLEFAANLPEIKRLKRAKLEKINSENWSDDDREFMGIKNAG